MGFKPGHKKAGGRQKGTLNRDTATLKERAAALGIDPFEILLLFAAEDWKRLGYEARTKTSYTNAGIEFEEFLIKPELRGKCAAEACQYIHPKRKAIEATYDPALLDKLKEMEAKTDKELLAIVQNGAQAKPTSTE